MPQAVPLGGSGVFRRPRRRHRYQPAATPPAMPIAAPPPRPTARSVTPPEASIVADADSSPDVALTTIRPPPAAVTSTLRPAAAERVPGPSRDQATSRSDTSLPYPSTPEAVTPTTAPTETEVDPASRTMRTAGPGFTWRASEVERACADASRRTVAA